MLLPLQYQNIQIFPHPSQLVPPPVQLTNYSLNNITSQKNTIGSIILFPKIVLKDNLDNSETDGISNALFMKELV